MTAAQADSQGLMATVVVPMYGVRPYIGECLQSIANQTISDHLQVVLVDDGSVDGTAEIAAEFVATRPLWTMIRQPNGGPGPGCARNRGLTSVRAPFVLFCDGDDAMEPDALERLVAAAHESAADVVVGAARQVPVARAWRWTHLFEPLDGSVLSGSVTDFPDLVHHPAPGDKLFRTEFLRRHNLRFGERIHHQDTLMSVPVLLGQSRVAVLRHVVQRYRRRADGTSIMDSHFTRVQNTWDHLVVIETLAALRPQLERERVALLDAFLVRSFQGFLARAATALPRPQAEQLFSRARQVFVGVPPSLVHEMTDGAVHALAYRAVLVDDVASFVDPSRGIKGLDLTDAELRLDAQVEPAWEGALQLGRLRGVLTGLDVDGDEIVLHGTVRVGGAPSLAHLGTAVLLRLRGAGVTVPVALSPEKGPAALTVSRFEARVDAGQLHPGTFALRVVLTEGSTQRSGRITVDVSGPLSVMAANTSFTAHRDEDGAALLTVAEIPQPSDDPAPRRWFRRATATRPS